jgi:N-acetylmuramoyl-L-alanine amidase
MAKIYLDAGHGGNDGGAAANGIKEKDIVLDVCKRIAAGLKNYENTTVVMSRDTDIFLSLSERTQKANKTDADLLLSVHINAAANKAAKGFESYVYTSVNSGTVAFQNVLHAEILRAMGTGIEDRGKKRANFHMVRESKMKAVLTENLFISNSSEAAKLKDAAFRQRIAEGHINGVVKFLGLKKKAGSAPKPEQPKEGKLYKIQVGAFSDKTNAYGLEKDLERNGISAFVNYEDGLYLVQAGAYSTEEAAESAAASLRKLGYRPYIKYE